MYSDVSLLIDGGWRPAVSGKTLPVLNPEPAIRSAMSPTRKKADLDLALAAAQKGFEAWRKVSAFERYKLMRKAADNLRARADEVATEMTMEQGKPRGEARWRRSPAPTSSTGSPKRAAAPMAAPFGARRRRLSARAQGTGRAGRRLHTMAPK